MSTKAVKNNKSNLINRLIAIADERVKWQVGYDSTHQALYLLLSNCLSLFKDSKKGTPEEVEFINHMKKELESRGLTIQSNINVMTLIVRYVFDNECPNVYTWARVLKVAVKEKVEPENFINWVNENNGIHNLAKGKGATKETKKKRSQLENAKKNVDVWLQQQLDNPIGVVRPQEFHESVDTGTYTLLIGFTVNDGSTKVLSHIPDCSEAMINAAKKKLAEFSIEHEEHIKTVQLVTERDKAINDAIYVDVPLEPKNSNIMK